MNAQQDILPLAVPERVTLELTNQCNLSCPVCPRHHMNYPTGDMDSKLFRHLTAEFANLGTTTLVPFFRGEPLLHRDCLALLAYAKDKGFTVQLATNGLLLTEAIARSFVEMGIDFVSFSVDAIQEETYAKHRKGGSFPRLLEAIDFLRTARAAARTALPHIQISAVDSGMSYHDKNAFTVFWQKRADRIRIYPQHTKDGRFGSLESQTKVPRKPCLKPFREMVVYWDGRLAICNHDWSSRAGLGKAGDSTLSSLWSSPAYVALRERHRCLALDDEETCAGCDHWLQYCAAPKLLGEIRS